MYYPEIFVSVLLLQNFMCLPRVDGALHILLMLPFSFVATAISSIQRTLHGVSAS